MDTMEEISKIDNSFELVKPLAEYITRTPLIVYVFCC